MCDDIVNLGDLLIIPSENVIGVANVWPFAITENSGALESLETDQSFKQQLIHCPALLEAYTLYMELLSEDGVHIK